jgi:hypothetical protein
VFTSLCVRTYAMDNVFKKSRRHRERARQLNACLRRRRVPFAKPHRQLRSDRFGPNDIT